MCHHLWKSKKSYLGISIGILQKVWCRLKILNGNSSIYNFWIRKKRFLTFPDVVKEKKLLTFDQTRSGVIVFLQEEQEKQELAAGAT